MLKREVVGRGLAVIMTGTLGSGAGLAASDAFAAPPSPEPAACDEALRRDATDGVETFTSPAEGSQVHVGDPIEMTAVWRAASFDAATVESVLQCVTVDDHLLVELSVVAVQVPNDGEFTHRFTVPTEVAPGSVVCGRSFVSGPLYGGVMVTEAGGRLCFTATGSPATGGGTPGRDPVRTAARRPPRPPGGEPPPVISEPLPDVTVVDDVPPRETATPEMPETAALPPPPPADARPAPLVAPEFVQDAAEEAPPPAPSAGGAPAAPAHLPDTGVGHGATATVGVLLTIGGLAICCGTKPRFRRRRA